MTKDGLIVDDPYGRCGNYRPQRTSDATAQAKPARSSTRKNLVDGSVRRDQPGTIDQTGRPALARTCTDESRGSSSTVSDATMSGAWRSLRFLEPAKPHKNRQPERPAGTV